MKRRAALAAMVATLLAMLAPTSARALDYQVTTLGDPFPSDNVCDTRCTLREAFQHARDNNNAPEVDRIRFAPGLTGKVTLTAGQLPWVDEPLALEGPGAKKLTISGDESSRIIKVTGGGDYMVPVTISGVTLADGSQPGEGGGAISSSDAVLTIRDSVLTDNFTDASGDGDGGAIQSEGPLIVERSSISGNRTLGEGSEGGGIWAPYWGLTLRDSTVAGNSTLGPHSLGGGIRTSGQLEGLEIENSTISGNSTSGDYAHGGGIMAETCLMLCSVSIDNSTIAGNSTADDDADGGGLWATDTWGGDLTIFLANSIVADNSAHGLPSDLDDEESALSYATSFSLVEAPGEATIRHSVPGSNLIGRDPRLRPLRANGGLTPTHALEPLSPALDRGSATVPDQRGKPRPFDLSFAANGTASGANAADMGAFELQRSDLPASLRSCGGKAPTIVSRGGTTVGTARRDVIAGTSRGDVIRGGGGGDTICGLGAGDLLVGGPGNDLILGAAAGDVLRGGRGADILKGGKGRDRLLGGPGRDLLRGGPGRDRQRQ